MKRIILFLALYTLFSVCADAQVIGPLIDAPWGQGEPFNRHCPKWDGEYPVEVGCVATSMTQIMAYYRYPECTLDTLFGWRTDHIKADTIMPGAPIDWDNILSDYRGSYTDAEAAAIADLSLYAATAVKMGFGRGSSGAEASHYVRELPRVFGYRSCIECDRAFYTQDAWRRLIINEMECGRPVLYTGHNMDLAGHAFVIDGYDYATGRFHANWGYNGTFDKWIDIDVMGQFEHPDDPTFWGLRESLYCNHYALLIHPTEKIKPGADSIAWHEGDVTVEAITPVTNSAHTGGYELLDIRLANHRNDTIAYTFEVLSNAPADTALFKQADYVALGCAILYPRETVVFRTSARYEAEGERILRLSNDDKTTQCATAVNVEAGRMVALRFGDVALERCTSREATFAVPITHDGSGTTGALITYCLFPEGGEEDLRHWQVVAGTAPRELTDRITFRALEPETTYTLKVRWPWDVCAECTFTTPDDASGVDGVGAAEGDGYEYYDLSGRRLPKRANGLYKRVKHLR